MKEARILHCEDDVHFCEFVEEFLAINGLHRVVDTASTLPQSRAKLEDIGDGTLDANVVLLDAYLLGSAHLNHPRVFRDSMKELGLDLPLIGLSAQGLAERGMVLGRDLAADITKQGFSERPELLQKILDDL